MQRPEAVRGSFRDKLAGPLVDSLTSLINERADEVLAELRATREELADTRQQLADALRGLEIRQRRDVFYAGEVRAAAETELFVAEHLVAAEPFPNPDATMEFATGLVTLDGLALEFGVAGGHSLGLMVAGLPNHEVYGFDVFSGLPEDWRPGFAKGKFAVDAPPDVPGATLVSGLFEDTLPGFLVEHPGPVALLHLDADLYSSTDTVLRELGDRLIPGSVVVLDEYFNFPGWQRGEYLAWQEFVERAGVEFRYEGYTFDNEQVVVTVTARNG